LFQDYFHQLINLPIDSNEWKAIGYNLMECDLEYHITDRAGMIHCFLTDGEIDQWIVHN
jgi:hypothetical protein